MERLYFVVTLCKSFTSECEYDSVGGSESNTLGMLCMEG